MQTAEDFMVMPRSCSSGLESKKRNVPASLLDMTPLAARSESKKNKNSCEKTYQFDRSE